MVVNKIGQEKSNIQRLAEWISKKWNTKKFKMEIELLTYQQTVNDVLNKQIVSDEWNVIKYYSQIIITKFYYNHNYVLNYI